MPHREGKRLAVDVGKRDIRQMVDADTKSATGVCDHLVDRMARRICVHQRPHS